MNEQWRQRQIQWERFRNWEAQHRLVELSPSERLTEIGALVDLARQACHPESEVAEDMEAKIQGVLVMRRRLAVLGRTT